MRWLGERPGVLPPTIADARLFELTPPPGPHPPSPAPKSDPPSPPPPVNWSIAEEDKRMALSCCCWEEGMQAAGEVPPGLSLAAMAAVAVVIVSCSCVSAALVLQLMDSTAHGAAVVRGEGVAARGNTATYAPRAKRIHSDMIAIGDDETIDLTAPGIRQGFRDLGFRPA